MKKCIIMIIFTAALGVHLPLAAEWDARGYYSDTPFRIPWVLVIAFAHGVVPLVFGVWLKSRIALIIFGAVSAYVAIDVGSSKYAVWDISLILFGVYLGFAMINEQARAKANSALADIDSRKREASLSRSEVEWLIRRITRPGRLGVLAGCAQRIDKTFLQMSRDQTNPESQSKGKLLRHLSRVLRSLSRLADFLDFPEAARCHAREADTLQKMARLEEVEIPECRSKVYSDYLALISADPIDSTCTEQDIDRLVELWVTKSVFESTDRGGEAATTS
jgi:hypothetical protein